METVEDAMIFISPLYLVICIVYVVIILTPMIVASATNNRTKRVSNNKTLMRQLWILNFAVIVGVIIVITSILLFTILITIALYGRSYQTFYQLVGASLTKVNEYLWRSGRSVHAYVPVVWTLIVLSIVVSLYSWMNRDFARKMMLPGYKDKTASTNKIHAFRRHYLVLFFMLLMLTYVLVILPIQKINSQLFYVNIAILVSIIAFAVPSMTYNKLFMIPTLFAMLIGVGISILPGFVSAFINMARSQ